MQDDVYNRALFRRKSEAARNKLREMAGVDRRMPQGIMASSPELMAAALPRAMAPQRTGMMPNMMAPQMRPAAPPMAQAPLPNIVPGMFPQPRPMQQPMAPQPMQQPQMAPQPMPMQQPQMAPQQMPMQQPMAPQPMQRQQPVRMNVGGDVALEALRQGSPEPSLGAQFQGIQAQAQRRPVDITETPTPREGVEVPDIASMVRERLGDNEEAQARFSQLEGALSDPNATAEDRQRAVTRAAGLPNTRDNFRDVVTQITGREMPASATVDQLNDAITGVALGGAIGGPGSVAERIADAMLVGLQAKRETATGRESFEQQLAVAGARSAGAGAAEAEAGSWLDSPEGKQAAELFRNLVTQRNLTVDAAIETMNSISPGLGERYKGAMAGGQMTAPGAAPRPANADQLLTQARDAIQQGRDRGVVEQMLRDMGVDPAEI